MEKLLRQTIFLLVLISTASSLYAERSLEIAKHVEQSESRHALVIGNGKYKKGSLRNPVNDARDMAKILKKTGFKVDLLTNATKSRMKKAIAKFGVNLEKSGGTGLFYYAGHGMQVKGINYLIPIAAEIRYEEDIEDEAIKAGIVLSKMKGAKNRLNIVFLDACRDNPFASAYRSSSSRGLAQMDAPTGSIIVYATAAGKTAADGFTRNGLFTGHLIRHMQRSGVSLTQMMMDVRRDVLRDSNNMQTPWDASSLIGNFYFIPPAYSDFDDDPPPPPPPPDLDGLKWWHWALGAVAAGVIYSAMNNKDDSSESGSSKSSCAAGDDNCGSVTITW
jgi:uncharacterized caspase-like protein